MLEASSSAGLLVAFLIYTKITYGLVALSFLGAWFVLSREGRVSACIALGCVVMTGVIVEAAWHLHQAYVSDVAFAARAVGKLAVVCDRLQ